MTRSIADELRGRVPAALLALWRGRGLETLLPLQVRVLRETGILSGRNLLVSAPSSAGKTLIGELAVARALGAGRRAIVLVPTRALAEQQAAAYETGLAGLGCRVLCATSDRPESDAPAAAGRYDVLVGVPEKLRALLISDSRPLAGVGTVVLDELQLLADPQRGPLLDLLVTQILQSVYAPQVVALAPELANASEVAAWLGAESVESRERPVALHEGVLALPDGRFHFREHGPEAREAGSAECEILIEPERLARLDEAAVEAAGRLRWPCGEAARSLLIVAAALAERHGPTLLFAPTRPCSRRWAAMLAEMGLGFGPARVALARLGRHGDAGRVVEQLAGCLETGVAFHNGDLDAELRTLIEQAFEEGAVRLLVSTSTLGVGVNLAARSVVHAPWRWGSAMEGPTAGSGRIAEAMKGRAARWSMPLPLGRAQFVNQGGRAGRYGKTPDKGLSVLVARTPGEAERLWSSLVAGPPEALDRAPLAGLSRAEIVLGLMAGGVRRTAPNLSQEARATFSARVEPGVLESLGCAAIEKELGSLERAGLASANAQGYWGLTRLGEAVLRGQVAPASLLEITGAMEAWASAGGAAPREDWRVRHKLLFALGLTAEGELARAGLPFGRRRPPLPLPEEAVDDVPAEAADPGTRRPTVDPTRNFVSRESLAWCAASALLDWIGGMETRRIEEKYDVMAGSLALAGEAMARLMFSAAAIARTIGPGTECAAALAELAERMLQGLRPEALPLARLRVAGISRDRMNALALEGLGHPERIESASLDRLTRLVEPEIAEALKVAARRWAILGPSDPAVGANAEAPPDPAPAGRSSSARPAAPLIEIHLQSPGIVRVRGREIQLPPLGFDLLVALAERPGQVVTRQALYHRLWPEGGPEDQQLDAHRRRLIGRLRPALGSDAVRAAEVVRGIGFRLALKAEEVRCRGGGRTSLPGQESGCAAMPAPG